MASRKDNKGRVLRKGESQRKDGLYQFRYTDQLKTRRTIYASDLNELRQKEKEIEKLLDVGMNFNAGKTKLIDQVRFSISIKKNLKSTTLRTYNHLIKCIEKHPIANKPINRITIMDCKLFMIKLFEDGYAFSSVKKVQSIIKEALKSACEDDILIKNPANFDLRDIIKDETQKVVALTKTQKNELLEFLKNNRYYKYHHDAFVVLLGTGLRIGEYCGITLSDIDFENHILHVTKQLVEGTDGLYVSTLKTNNGIRDIPLTEEVEKSLRNIIEKRSVKIEPMVSGYVGFICLSKNGRPRYTREMNYIFSRISKRFNEVAENPITRLTPHVLRHTFCTELIAAGVQVKTVQYLMGHAFASTTLDVYTDFCYESILADMEQYSQSS